MSRPRRALQTRGRRLLDTRKQFTWQGPFERWSRAWVHKNFWRVRALFLSEEDALQECALIFARCVDAYHARVDNPAWMMALFKTAVINDWHTFAQRDARMRDVVIEHDDEVEVADIDYNLGPLVAAWHEASEELQQVLSIILKAPSEVLEFLFSSRSENVTNQRLRRLCGIHNRAVNVLSELRQLLS